MDTGAFTLFRCKECGCLSSDALVRHAATTFVPQRYFGREDRDKAKWKRLLPRITKDWRRPRSVLDVGCGGGAFLGFLEHQGSEMMLAGIEVDKGRAEQARARVPTARIYTGAVEAVLNQIDGTFDLITLWDVFEHLAQPCSVLQALAGKVNKNGCIFIQTIHESSLVPLLGRASYHLTGGRLRSLIRRTHEAHHLVFFTRKGLGILAREANLEIEDLWFDRLCMSRMDGNPLVVAATSMLLTFENMLGNGLFVDLILKPLPHRQAL
ncbi:class I SAM-dependent methyltransferase [Candidatus Nitrospira bockiana]